VAIRGVGSAVPAGSVTIDDDARRFGETATQRLVKNTGVVRRHVVVEGQTTSDLCEAAASQLLDALEWERESIDALIFVSQTPDYLLPATACTLQDRLGLPTTCASFDVNLGCSGYVYGLWMASHFVSAKSARRALLLVGDTISRISSPDDRAVGPLFGDAGTATAIEAGDDDSPWFFELGSDGSGRDHLIVPAGGFRTPRSAATAKKTEGNGVRSAEQLAMNGAEVFAFTLQRVPGLLKSVTDAAGWSREDVDAYVLHQASKFIVDQLARRLGVEHEKVVLALSDYGNTSSASIPLALTTHRAASLRAGPCRLVMAGFGVGLSWAAVALSTGPIVVPELIISEPIMAPA
jgi:3-oxoacyl-[acyl-carrier-protein] synthase-3